MYIKLGIKTLFICLDTNNYSIRLFKCIDKEHTFTQFICRAMYTILLCYGLSMLVKIMD